MFIINPIVTRRLLTNTLTALAIVPNQYLQRSEIAYIESYTVF